MTANLNFVKQPLGNKKVSPPKLYWFCAATSGKLYMHGFNTLDEVLNCYYSARTIGGPDYIAYSHKPYTSDKVYHDFINCGEFSEVKIRLHI